MTAFATAADLLQRYDYRLLAQLIPDTGTAINEAAVLASPIVATALAQASGEVLARAFVGGRYSETDLASLTGNGQAFLVGLVCDLAITFFPRRRGLPIEDYPQSTKALEWMDMLATGHAIFPIQANADAGVAQSPPITIETIVNNNYLVNDVRYFPTPRFTLNQIG